MAGADTDVSQLEREIAEAGTTPGMEAVPIERLRRMGRRQNRDKLSTSIPGQYYINNRGWVAHAAGMETAQAQRLVNVKGWKVLDGYPRTLTDQERPPGGQPFHGLLRAGGAKEFPPDQIVTYRWHKKPPTVLTCRETLDDFQHPAHDKSCYTVMIFPQLEGVEVFEETCPMCPRPPVVSVKGRLDAEGQIKRHMEVAHREHLVNKELVTGLRDALAPLITQGQQGGQGQGMTPDEVASIAAAAAVAAVQAMATSPGEPEPEVETAKSTPPKRGSTSTKPVAS